MREPNAEPDADHTLDTRHSTFGSPSLPPRRVLLQRSCFVLARPLMRAYFRLRAEGLEQLPRGGPYLMTPNHVSMLDWAFLLGVLPEPLRFVVERPYYDHPVFGLGLRWNGAVGIHTDRADLRAMRAARSILSAGEPLILFPEGRISLTGRPQSGLPGVIFLAAALQVPIVPAAIRGAFESFPRWARVPRPRRVTVVFGKPLAPPPKASREQQQRLADALMEHVGALLDDRPRVSPW